MKPPREKRARAARVAAALALLLAATSAGAVEGWLDVHGDSRADHAAPGAAARWAPPDFGAGLDGAAEVVPALLALPVPLAPAVVAPEDGAVVPAHLRLRESIVSAARALLGRPFRGDCSGFVLSLLRKVGVRAELPPARSRSESLWLGGDRVEAPAPGDLAFFHDTYDRNHDGRLNDRWTHVALVEKVEGEFVTLLHRGIHGVERIRMDLAHPSDASANAQLRIPKKGDPPGTRLLAGELFSGFGAVAR